MGFLLDIEVGTLSFFVNGKDQGVAFEGLSRWAPLHPVFCLDNQDEQVSMVLATTAERI